LRDHSASRPLALLVMLSGAATTGYAQYYTAVQGLRVGPNVQVSRGLAEMGHNEVVTCASLTDSAALVVGAMLDGGTLSRRRQVDDVIYGSSNRGSRWLPVLDLRRRARSSVDPACAFGPGGRAYFATIYSGALAVFRSADYGRTWEGPALAPESRGIDRPWVAADRSHGRYRGRVYVHAQVGPVQALSGEELPSVLTLFRSRDGGRSFERPVKGLLAHRRAVVVPGDVLVLGDGTVAALYVEAQRCPTDGSGPPGYACPPRMLKLYASVDGGQTLNPSVAIAPVKDWSIPRLAVDEGRGPFAGTLYVVWSDSADRTGTRILVAHSSDRGATWSAPAVASDAMPFNTAMPGPRAILPAIAVNSAGVVGVSWYDERAAAGRASVGNYAAGIDMAPRFAVSLDGGETFLPSLPLADSAAGSIVPLRAEVTGPEFGGAELPSGSRELRVGLGAVFLGHTAGIASDAGGLFHPVWVDSRTGIPQVWTAAVTVSDTAAPNGGGSLASLEDVSLDVQVQLATVQYDRAKQVVTAEAWLRNTSAGPLRGPLYLRALSLECAIGQVAGSNSQNGVHGPGAVWAFSGNSNGDGVLPPGGQTLPTQLTFQLSRLSDGPPSIVGTAGELVHLRVRVFGRRTKRTPGT
jgi:hypothetical protein